MSLGFVISIPGLLTYTTISVKGGPVEVLIGLGIASPFLGFGWFLFVPELRPAAPPAPGDPEFGQAPRSDWNVLLNSAKGYHHRRALGKLLGALFFSTVMMVYSLFVYYTDPEINRDELADQYCIFLAQVRCTDVPDHVTIRRWEQMPTILFARTPGIKSKATEDWESSIRSTVRDVLDAGGYGRRLNEIKTIPANDLPHITVAFFNGSERPDKKTMHAEGRAPNNVIDRVQVELDLEDLERQFEEIKPGPRATPQGRYGKRVLNRVTSSILGIDTSWTPAQDGVYIVETHAELQEVIYRLHHDPLLVAGIAFNDQRDAFNGILDRIYADPESWLD